MFYHFHLSCFLDTNKFWAWSIVFMLMLTISQSFHTFFMGLKCIQQKGKLITLIPELIKLINRLWSYTSKALLNPLNPHDEDKADQGSPAYLHILFLIARMYKLFQ